MFKIYDGREHFYQWDLDRRLIVEDPSITEVHFCNRTDNCSLVCETFVEDGLTLVNVPNILLQTDWKIRVYAYDGSYTKHDACYEVKSRTKPSDYVYTETEVYTVEKLVDKALEEALDVDKIANDVLENIPKAQNGSGEYGLVKLGSNAKGITLTGDGELILKEASLANLENNSTQLVVTKPSLFKHLVALGTHQQMNDKYDVNSISVPSSFNGKQGELPASYNAVKAYVDTKIEEAIENGMGALPDGDEVSY